MDCCAGSTVGTMCTLPAIQGVFAGSLAGCLCLAPICRGGGARRPPASAGSWSVTVAMERSRRARRTFC